MTTPLVSKNLRKHPRTRQTLRFLCAASIFLLSVPSFGAEADKSKEMAELPLEQLMDVTVISASRKNQSLSEVASSVFVINQDDIHHSGATTIPDLLRMVPGVQVASVDGTTWAVSIRGFNGTYANKLLVMIDGRTIYTPLYGGVFWDVQDVQLENIERIEVIRGPGSTMWGANAVNGVINIITKNAQDTKGTRLSAITGSQERRTLNARYGAGIGDNTSYRLYVKDVDRSGTSGPTPDSLKITRGGFRVDSVPAYNLNLTVQGDVYSGAADHTITVPQFTPPFSTNLTGPVGVFGANILSRLDWLQSDSSKVSLQLYYDRTGRDTQVFKEDRDTIDVDLQHNLRIASHEITWGAGYRYLHDNTPGSAFFIITPQSRYDALVNLFMQDEITLLPEKLRFIIGTKFEHKDLTGWELEPSAKLSWTPYKGYSLWASVTRSVRTPTRVEQDARLLGVNPGPPQLFFISPTGNRELDSEDLLAYELGFRADLLSTLSLDISTFYNRYTDIIGPVAGMPFLQPGQLAGPRTVPLMFENSHSYDSSGGEVSLQWQPREWWKVKGGYSYIRFFGVGVEDSAAVKATPTNQATLRSMMALGRYVDFDLGPRYVGDSRYPLTSGTVLIPAYFTMDARLAWRPIAGVELSLVGQNLLTQHHLETITDQTAVRHEIERTVYGKVSWAF